MTKSLVVDDRKEYLDIPESFLRLKEKIGDLKLASNEAEKLLKSEISSIPQPIHESGGVYTPETPPRKYVKPKTLKEIILESSDPRLAVYKRLISYWKDIPESELKRIIQEVPSERISQILDLVDVTGFSLSKFERFLSASISSSEVDMLDSLTRFYKYLWPKYEPIVKMLDEKIGIDYNLEIDNRLYKFKAYLLIDREQVRLDYYSQGHDKVLGIPKSELKCRRNLEVRLNKLLEELKNNPNISLLEEIRYLLIDLERFKYELIQIDPQKIVKFPPELNRYKTYLSEYVSPFNCPACNMRHVYITILKW